MQRSKNTRSWVLVADRSHLRLFEKTNENPTTAIELREEFVYPEGRKKGHQLVSDRPGRSFDRQDITEHGQTGGTRHSLGGSPRPEDHAAKVLVEQARQMIDLLGVAGSGNEVAIVAEPRLIGWLREAITPKKDLRLVFHEKDFAWVDSTDLPERLADL